MPDYPGYGRSSETSLRRPRRSVEPTHIADDLIAVLDRSRALHAPAAIRAEKAVVGRTLLAMAKQYPNPDFWKVDIAPTKPTSLHLPLNYVSCSHHPSY